MRLIARKFLGRRRAILHVFSLIYRIYIEWTANIGYKWSSKNLKLPNYQALQVHKFKILELSPFRGPGIILSMTISPRATAFDKQLSSPTRRGIVVCPFPTHLVIIVTQWRNERLNYVARLHVRATAWQCLWRCGLPASLGHFADPPHWRGVLRTAFPIAVAKVPQIVFNIIDSFP